MQQQKIDVIITIQCNFTTFICMCLCMCAMDLIFYEVYLHICAYKDSDTHTQRDVCLGVLFMCLWKVWLTTTSRKANVEKKKMAKSSKNHWFCVNMLACNCILAVVMCSRYLVSVTLVVMVAIRPSSYPDFQSIFCLFVYELLCYRLVSAFVMLFIFM